jgi:hypothetical protein
MTPHEGVQADEQRLETWQGLKAHIRLIDVIGTAESRALLQSARTQLFSSCK